MKSFSSWMILMLMAIFWILRVIVAVTDGMSVEFFLTPLDATVEIALLFVALLCMVLVYKRKILGAILYLISYGLYFGVYLYQNISTIISGGVGVSQNVYINVMVSLLAMILPVVTLLELLAEKNHEAHPVSKETDWFYTNKEYERKLDERADKNQYRTL